MRTTGHGEVELQPAFLLFLPPRRRGIRSLLIMRHPALHASDTHVATRRWILQISFGTHCYVAQQQGTSYPSQVPSLEGGVGINARARAHTHTHTCKCTCKHARVRAHTPHTYKQRTRKQSAHAEGKCGTAHKMATAANPARRAQARYAHAADLARARRAAVVVHSRNACLSERHTRQLIAPGALLTAPQIEPPAGATRGGPSQPSYGPHVKARACVYAHPCVLGTHCPHPSLPHSTGTHSLSDTHTHRSARAAYAYACPVCE